MRRLDMPNINTTESHKIAFGSHVIPFELQYSKRKTLEISVYPDMSVVVKAPATRSFEEVKEKILKRGSWILEQRYFFSLYLPKQPEKKYVSGETHIYLGRQYRLKVVTSSEEKVVLKRGYIFVHTKDKTNSKPIQKLLDAWYRERASIKFRERLNICLKKLQKYGIKTPQIQIRKMSSRWGSCSENGRITLNTQLIKAPSQCIDYVITHEMCHLKYFNHGKAFYNLLVQVMPDWEKRKGRLESIVL